MNILCILLSLILFVSVPSLPAAGTQPAGIPGSSAAEASAAVVPAETFSDPDAYLAYRKNLDPDSPWMPFSYENDPAENPRALEDAVVNADAVFGFSPNPESIRLKDYAGALDWTSPEEVAQARQARREYHESMRELYRIIEAMLHETKPVEEIARAVSLRRNELRLESYHGDPDGLAIVKKSNLEKYGDELGPSADSLYEKYGSWQLVLEKALGTNAGMDACLGFYDELFELYEITAE